MINRLIEFSLKNRFLILIAYALLANVTIFNGAPKRRFCPSISGAAMIAIAVW